MFKFYAQLDSNDVCIGISQIHSKSSDKDLIELPFMDEDKLGRSYNRNNTSWGDIVPVAQPIIRIISIGSLDERFSMDESVAIENSTNDYVKVLNKRLGRKAYVNLDDPAFSAGLELLVLAGLLTAERKIVLLSNGTEAEAYRGVL